MSKAWMTAIVDGDVHITPWQDLVDHEPTEDCLCGPSLEIVQNDDEPDGHVYTHHSLDGREANE